MLIAFQFTAMNSKNGTLYVKPDEAEIVRLVFSDFLNGMGRTAIMKKLKNMGMLTQKGFEWRENAIDRILRNEKYAGDMMLQKVYSSNHLEKRKTVNHGELPMFYVKDCHEAIIDRDTFERTQAELARRAEAQSRKSAPSYSTLTGKIECAYCGKNYRRKINNAGTKYAKAVWICSTYNRLGKDACSSKQIPEPILLDLITELDGIVKKFIAHNDSRLELILTDDSVQERSWQY